jgi:hypothetical protein
VINIPQRPSTGSAFRFEGPAVYRALARVHGQPDQGTLIVSAVQAGWGPTQWWWPGNFQDHHPEDWPTDELQIKKSQLPPAEWIARMQGVWIGPPKELETWPLEGMRGSVALIQVWRCEGSPTQPQGPTQPQTPNAPPKGPEVPPSGAGGGNSIVLGVVAGLVLTTTLGLAMMFSSKRALRRARV